MFNLIALDVKTSCKKLIQASIFRQATFDLKLRDNITFLIRKMPMDTDFLDTLCNIIIFVPD